MNSYATPGVYIREVEAAPLAGQRLDIAGFVGQAERGPLNLSAGDYQLGTVSAYIPHTLYSELEYKAT